MEKLVQQAPSLKKESDKLWTEIVDQSCKFDIETKKAEELKKNERKDMIDWCRKYLDGSSSNCRRLKVRFWPNDQDDDSLDH
ncbi:insulin-degrading enzyme-like, partial [Trifolium medium]|nr:insulin-degrading enzyme-like [Trifolium medium]